jgi:hypothetical protein
MIALQWLRKIDKRLLDIVRTEYSTELKGGTQLADLVPSIAPNIDNLFSRYSNSSVQKVVMDKETEEDDDEVDDSEVRYNRQDRYRGGRGQAGSFPGRGGGDRKPPNRFSTMDKKTFFCPGCKKLVETKNASIDFRHLPAKCPRRFMIRSIQLLSHI